MRRLRSVGLALSVASLIAARAAAAEEGAFQGPAPVTPVTIGAPETYGTASRTTFIIPSVNFTPRIATTTYLPGNGMERYVTTAGAVLGAAPMLPSGALVERIELRACDTDPAAQVELIVGTCPTPGALCTAAGSVATGLAATPGCTNFGTNLAVPFPVDNQNVPILVHITTGTTEAATFSAVKLSYRLRVSPAPLIATFPADVPLGHPFFRFIEALAAAGITSGCGVQMYCPNNPVTRGEMAVFLAVALGLHFPS